FFFSSRRRHTRCLSDWSSDVCSSDLDAGAHRERCGGPGTVPGAGGGGRACVDAPGEKRRDDRRQSLAASTLLVLQTRALSPRSRDRKSTRLNSSHLGISYAVFCLKKK